MVADWTTVASRWNFDAISSAHCSQRCGAQSTAMRRTAPRSSRLPRDHASLDRLADADIVGDQQPHRVEPECHQERHVLIRTRLDRQPAQRSKRAGAAAQIEPHGVEDEACTRAVASGGRIG